MANGWYSLCTMPGDKLGERVPCSGVRGQCINCGKKVRGKRHYSIDGEDTLCWHCYEGDPVPKGVDA